jgi:hypothetical protein
LYNGELLDLSPPQKNKELQYLDDIAEELEDGNSY